MSQPASHPHEPAGHIPLCRGNEVATGKAAPPPKVTVVLLTYNHAPYIAQAIESVLMQRAEFGIELVVLEDCSTDGTQQILLDFERRYPETIRLRLAAKNCNDNISYADAILNASGDYVALLDGDDYWTAEDKLATQVAVLEDNRSYAVCFHNVEVVYDDSTIPSHAFHLAHPNRYHSRAVPAETTGLVDIVAGNFMQTASVMFRRGLFKEFPAWFNEMPVADWPLHVLNAQYGKIRYIDRIMAAYRVHPGGLWSSQMSRFDQIEKVEQMLKAYELIDDHLNRRYRRLIHARTRWLFEIAAQLCYNSHNHSRGNKYVLNYLKGLPLWRRFLERKLIVRMLCGNVPFLAAARQRILDTLGRSRPAGSTR